MPANISVSLGGDRGFVYSQLLDNYIESGFASSEARTAKTKLSKALQERKFVVSLTPREVSELLEAIGEPFEGYESSTYAPAGFEELPPPSEKFMRRKGVTPYPRELLE